jgi:hypothetical protein
MVVEGRGYFDSMKIEYGIERNALGHSGATLPNSYADTCPWRDVLNRYRSILPLVFE